MSLLDKLRKKDTPKQAAPEKKAVKASDKKADKAAKKAAKAEKKSEKKADKKTEKNAAVKAAPQTHMPNTTADAVLVRPVVTEKATLTGTYVFEVSANTNKQEVKKAIQKMYGVTPVKVGIMNVAGKKTRWGQRLGKQKDWKKAVVRLKEGETINVYEGT